MLELYEHRDETTATSMRHPFRVLWLFDVVHEFVEAVARGEKSWWPFIVSVVVITPMAVAVSTWLG